MPGTAGYRVWEGGIGQRLVVRRNACERFMEERTVRGGHPYLANGEARPPRKGKMLKIKDWRTAARPAKCVEPGD